jgi:uncharacterized protein
VNFDLRAHTILLTLAGSRSYGIHLPTSDVDVKGVCIPPGQFYHGFVDRFEQADKSSQINDFADTLTPEETEATSGSKLEGTVYELRKFIGLAAEANPNLIETLFCRDAEIRFITPLGEKLRENRDLFLSAKAKHTFTGYSASQMKRIRGHRAWLLHPPSHQPTRAEYGLPETTLIPADHLAAANAAVRKQIDSWELDFSGIPEAETHHVLQQVESHLTEIRTHLGFDSTEDTKWLAAARKVGLDDNLIHVMQREREYASAMVHFQQYEAWKKNRNVDRAALEAKHGYDTKHAGHLVRLLRMGKEILLTGKVNVWRGDIDADDILAIRNGEWEYDRLVEWADAADAELSALYNERKYVVPKQPDRVAINNLCIKLVEAALVEAALAR